MKQKVALVLASGGARGLAHIGAIEELESRGYEITSIAGTSIGALIAGVYASGKLAEAKQWFLKLDRLKIFQLGDFAISRNYLVKGDRTVEAFKEIVPDCNIEDLPIPVTLVASDIIHNREVVMQSGSLFDAVRASVSIPLFFRPVEKDDMLLVDGGILNALPLNRVHRTIGDILAAFNISARDVMQTSAQTLSYPQLLERMTDMMIQNNVILMKRMVKCDILAEMPMNQYPTLAFDKTAEIIELGRTLMRKAIDDYEVRLYP